MLHNLSHLLSILGKYFMLWGIPGLFAIAFIDAASVPLVGGPDYAVLFLACIRPAQAIPIALAATLGSSLGYFVLYRIARFGGEMALARFNVDRRAWIQRKLDQNAFFAVAAGVAAPPPFPTKLVIVAAGAFNVGQIRFITGLVVGRLVRYLALAYLGATYGDRAISILKLHFPGIALVAVAAFALFFLIRYFFVQAKTAPGE